MFIGYYNISNYKMFRSSSVSSPSLTGQVSFKMNHSTVSRRMKSAYSGHLFLTDKDLGPNGVHYEEVSLKYH